MAQTEIVGIDTGKSKDVLAAELAAVREQLATQGEDARAATRETAAAQGDELEAARRGWSEAERLGRLKDEFLANLSHELRTPINAILGWSQLLRPGDVTPEDLAEGLDVIQRQARAQVRLIDDLLDMSRIVSGKLRLDVQRVELPAVIEAALEAVRPAADAKKIRVETVVDPLAGPVTGDPGRLQQIFWNLMSNAVKFTPKGGKVQVALERVNSHVELSVSDNGQGIAPEMLPHVFERLSQGDSSPGKKQPGLGLGLSIVKSLAEMHGGSVRAKSAGAGKGATFSLTLPISVVHARPDDRGRRHPTTDSDLASPVFSPPLDGVHVLLVDDDPDALEVVKRILRRCKARVTTAISALEGLALLAVERPDVVLADIGLPQMDGYEFVRRVRVLPSDKGGNVPVAALTAFARSEDRRQAMLAGFDIHVAKPVDPAELVAVVGRLARRT
jgi:signal transduction histidine kinase/CheY-like chemotaxis protein